MARKTVSLLPLILRLLIAATIAGVLSLCSLAIERTKGFFKLSDGAGIHKCGSREIDLLLTGQRREKDEGWHPDDRCEVTARLRTRAHVRAEGRLSKTLERFATRASLRVASPCARRIPSGTGKIWLAAKDPGKFRLR